jgi:hypothetical protein
MVLPAFVKKLKNLANPLILLTFCVSWAAWAEYCAASVNNCPPFAAELIAKLVTAIPPAIPPVDDEHSIVFPTLYSVDSFVNSFPIT